MSLVWAESTVKQYMQWIQRIQAQKSLNLVGNGYCSSSLTWEIELQLGGLSSNLEESIRVYTLINLERSIPHLQMSTWNMPERKAWPSLPKKRLTLWGRSKHVVVNVIILYMRSISLSFVKQVKQPHKQCFCIFLLSLNMLRVVNVLPCVCVRRFSKENLLVILLRI